MASITRTDSHQRSVLGLWARGVAVNLTGGGGRVASAPLTRRRPAAGYIGIIVVAGIVIGVLASSDPGAPLTRLIRGACAPCGRGRARPRRS